MALNNSNFSISDDYVVYQRWAYGRQTCLAHLIREAKGLVERTNPLLSRPGAWALKELWLLCRMAKHSPSVGQWNMFYARLVRLIGVYRDQYENIYLHAYETGSEARRGINAWIDDYNQNRGHSSLADVTAHRGLEKFYIVR